MPQHLNANFYIIIIVVIFNMKVESIVIIIIPIVSKSDKTFLQNAILKFSLED